MAGERIEIEDDIEKKIKELRTNWIEKIMVQFL